MIATALLAFALTAATGAGAPPRIDTSVWFSSVDTEASERTALMARIDDFAARSAHAPASPAALLALLQGGDALQREVRRHGDFVHLRAEEDTGNLAAAAADAALDAALARIDTCTRQSLERLGRAAAAAWLAGEPSLAPWRFRVETSLGRPAAAFANEQAVAVLARPALDSLANAYGDLRRAARQGGAASATPADAQATFHAAWSPFVANEPAFAALFVPVVSLEEGQARLQGYASAADAAYASRQLSSAQVHAVLAAIRPSTSWTRFTQVVAAAAARRMQVDPARVNAWDLASADGWQPPPIAFADAVPLILDAARTMGPEYAQQFERLFDPARRRVELCNAEACDDTGFSIGVVGTTSGLFYGHFDGSTNSLRATAHEAAHAVDDQFMNEHQPIAGYHEGPHFMGESFAIFNELLFLDHLQRTAPAPAARARYLHAFLDDATFQVFGSAQETSLEETLHARVHDGSARTAADLDALALDNLATWLPPQRRSPEMKATWARNRLYFSDSFYDVNYLFAGLLALEYLHRFERDPQDFERRYVALLKNGYDDTAAALLRRFLDIDLDDGATLVRDATDLIDRRTTTLEGLYQAIDGAPAAR